MKKGNTSSDNRSVPYIRRNKIRHSLIPYIQSKSIKNIHISDINPLSLPSHSFYVENLTEKIREEEILESPLVKSIKRSKLLFEESLAVDDHYSDSLV